MNTHLKKFLAIIYLVLLTNHTLCAEKIVHRKMDEAEAKQRSSENIPVGQDVYCFETSGFKEGDQYQFLYTNLRGNSTLARNYTVNHSGRLMSTDDSLDQFYFYPDGYANGEPIIFTLKNVKTGDKTSTTIVPNTIGAKWSDGAYVTITADDPQFSHFSLEGFDFGIDEPILLTSYVDDEIVEGKLTTTKKGSLCCILMPQTIESTNGICKLVLKRVKTNEEKTIRFSFGPIGAVTSIKRKK